MRLRVYLSDDEQYPFSFIILSFKSIRVDPGRSGLIRVDPTRIKRSELIRSEFCTCIIYRQHVTPLRAQCVTVLLWQTNMQILSLRFQIGLAFTSSHCYWSRTGWQVLPAPKSPKSQILSSEILEINSTTIWCSSINLIDWNWHGHHFRKRNWVTHASYWD